MKETAKATASNTGKQNPHQHHRRRLKERFLREGLENFSIHQVIELLLFYGIPQKDTNELAHRLVEKFGSVSRLFDADFSMLCEVDGMGEHTATLIKLIPQIWCLYHIDKLNASQNLATRIENAGKYLVSRYIGITMETVFLLLYNSAGNLIDCIKICEGTFNSVNVSSRKIAEIMMRSRASCFILAHNHPDGNSAPSDDDIHTTRWLKQIFYTLDMPMIEHFIICGNNFYPIIS